MFAVPVLPRRRAGPAQPPLRKRWVSIFAAVGVPLATHFRRREQWVSITRPGATAHSWCGSQLRRVPLKGGERGADTPSRHDPRPNEHKNKLGSHLMRVNKPITQEEYVLPDGEVIITRTDARGFITYANQAFLSSSGFTLAECMGQPQNIVRHPDMPPVVFADMWRTIRAGKAWTGIVKNRRKDGGFYWVRANVTPMLENGRAVGFMSVRVKPAAADVAAAEQLYRELREGRAPHIRFHEGEAIDTRWSRRIRCLARLPLVVGTWMMLGLIAFLFGAMSVLAQADAGGALMWSLALMGMGVALANAFYVSNRVAMPMRVAGTTAVRIIGGDMNCEFPESKDLDTQRLVRLLNQMNAKLLGVLKDAHHGIATMQIDVAHILDANEELSRRTSAHAAGLEEAAASMGRMTSTLQRSTENAEQANALSIRAARTTQRGQNVVRDLGETMSEIDAAAREIAEIVGLVDSIAFQTNLLALNAAIEAARAGEHGRGFAVVAQEVRALALRSSTSAANIRQLIDRSLTQVERGAKLAQDAGDTMEAIVTSVDHVTRFMGEILASSREQSAGIEQINRAVATMDQMTQQDAAMAEEVIGIATRVQQHSLRVRDALGAFDLGNSMSTSSLEQIEQFTPVHRYEQPATASDAGHAKVDAAPLRKAS